MDTQNDPPAKAAEKVIQPLDPTMVSASTTLIPVQPRPELYNVSPTVTSSYDPSADASGYRVPTLDLRQSIPGGSIKRVAAKHKSLMILAILGLLDTAFAVYSALQAQAVIHEAQLTNARLNTGSAQLTLNITYGVLVFNFFIYAYLLLAKDLHTVVTVLKILVIMAAVAVFGVFWGGSPAKGVNLLVDGAYLAFTYIVYNVIKTAQRL